MDPFADDLFATPDSEPTPMPKLARERIWEAPKQKMSEPQEVVAQVSQPAPSQPEVSQPAASDPVAPYPANADVTMDLVPDGQDQQFLSCCPSPVESIESECSGLLALPTPAPIRSTKKGAFSLEQKIAKAQAEMRAQHQAAIDKENERIMREKGAKKFKKARAASVKKLKNLRITSPSPERPKAVSILEQLREKRRQSAAHREEQAALAAAQSQNAQKEEQEKSQGTKNWIDAVTGLPSFAPLTTDKPEIKKLPKQATSKSKLQVGRRVRRRYREGEQEGRVEALGIAKEGGEPMFLIKFFGSNVYDLLPAADAASLLCSGDLAIATGRGDFESPTRALVEESPQMKFNKGGNEGRFSSLRRHPAARTGGSKPGSPAGPSSAGGAPAPGTAGRAPGTASKSKHGDWSEEQLHKLQQAYNTVNPADPQFWDKVAYAVGRSVPSCRSRMMILHNQEMEAAERRERNKSPSQEREKPKVDNVAKRDGPMRQKQVRAVVMGQSFGPRENLLLGVVPKSESGSGEKENKVVPVITDANCPFEQCGPDGFATAPKNMKSQSALEYNDGIKPQPLFQSPFDGMQIRSPSESYSYEGGRDSISPGYRKFSKFTIHLKLLSKSHQMSCVSNTEI